jgi:hypothetical protein
VEYDKRKITAWSNRWYWFHFSHLYQSSNGPFSMGYDPTDYFDFEHNQMAQ